MQRLIAEASKQEEDGQCVISIPVIFGGAKTFELLVRFFYGFELELTASKVVCLRCAAEQLEMTEDYGEGNLVAQTETFLNQVVLRNWKDSLQALEMCNYVFDYAEELQITERCIEALAMKVASTDPKMEHKPMQSRGESVLQNGISKGTKSENAGSDWWYEDVSNLSLPLYKRLISAMKSQRIESDLIVGSLAYYARKYLPDLNGPQHLIVPSSRLTTVASEAPLPEEDQKALVEEIDNLLLRLNSLVPTELLCGLLQKAMILKASPTCLSNLKKRIGRQLKHATVKDLLMLTSSDSIETRYNVDCVQRILKHFLAMFLYTGRSTPRSVDDGQPIGPLVRTPLGAVAKLIDGYLAIVATDPNLKVPNFQVLAATLPSFVRPLDDGLYDAIDIYLKSHPQLTDSEREQLSGLMDIQKLSPDACDHAAKNERLGSAFSTTAGLSIATTERQTFEDKVNMRFFKFEKKCLDFKLEIEKLSRQKEESIWKNFGFKIKSLMCSRGFLVSK